MFAAVGMVGLIGYSATTVMKGPVATMQQVTKRTIAEDNILASSKLTVLNAAEQAGGADCDGDGLAEPMAWSSSGTGTAPTGGGFLPAGLGVGLLDPWGRSYGYCVWDHGSAIRNGTCASDDRLAGHASAAGVLVAIISSGPDKKFQTSCAASPTFVQKVAGSDDLVTSFTYAEAEKVAGGLWNLKSGDDTTAQIGKKLEVKDGGGNVTFALDNTTGAGTFEEVTTGTITGLGTDPIEMGSGLQLADETDAPDVDCTAGAEGTLRNHSTEGMQVCDGTAYVSIGGGGGGGGYSYGGLYEGKISAGYHTCGLRADGTAYCWGYNGSGELGNGTTTNSLLPIAVVGDHKFLQIKAGQDYTCGLRTDGAAYCWGSNANRQLGDGTTTNSLTPVPVSGGHKFVQISVRSLHTCGLRTDGAAYCWGGNSHGQLGDGTSTDRAVPTAVTGGHKFIQITVGANFTCGLRSDGAAYCWGQNFYGQLGDGTTAAKSVPTAVSGGHKFAYLAGGYLYNCAIRTDGAAYCWGMNSNGAGGALGDGTNINKSVPTPVSGNHKFIDLATSHSHACGIRTDGAAYCWGDNYWGGLGDGTTTTSFTPVAVLGGPFVEISANSQGNACALKADGAAYCWGLNSYGRLGDGTTTASSIPTHVSGFSMVESQNNAFQFGNNEPTCDSTTIGTMRYKGGVLELCDGAAFKQLGAKDSQYNYSGIWEGKISTGSTHTCALRADGAAYCWGENVNGRLGDGTTTARYVPTAVNGGHKFMQLMDTSTSYSTCALRADGAAYCWGQNAAGQLGDGTTTERLVPTAVNGSHKFVQLAGGYFHTCGLRTDGEAYCWGYNNAGQLGDGTSVNKSLPTAVTGGHKFVQLVGGYNHTCGLRSDGAAYCWGQNSFGYLGDGTTTNRYVPTAVSGGYKFARLGYGGYSTCGLRTDGAAYCWGINTYGQLGDGTNTHSYVPTAVSGGHKFLQIGGGTYYTCGLRTDGAAYCWGRNSNSQLGDGTSTNTNVPTAVSGGYKFAQISSGADHTCGLRIDGTAYCWGANSFGRLGDGTTTNRSIPTHVPTFSMTETQKSSFKFGNDANACGAGNSGALRYTGGAVWEYCNGTSWTTFASSVSASGVTWDFVNGSCAIRSNGDAYCWGGNSSGPIGDGTTTQRETPTAVLGGHKFKQYAVISSSVCGLRTDGAAYCSGANNNGQLGNGNTTDQTTPVAVSGGYKFKELTNGNSHRCGLTTSGAAYCWGYNNKGQLGNGTTTWPQSTPSAVTGSHVFVHLAAGPDNHSCGIRNDGATYCWGNNGNGQLGDASTTDRTSPVLVGGSHKFVQLAVGASHTCGLRSDGAAYCWGLNTNGQVGDNSTTQRTSPVSVNGGHKFIQLSAGYSSTCGIRSDGAAYCWGVNNIGQLGDGTTTQRLIPTIVTGGHKFIKIGLGSSNGCGLTSSGSIYCWGVNTNGQGGNGTTTSPLTSPVKVSDP